MGLGLGGYSRSLVTQWSLEFSVHSTAVAGAALGVLGLGGLQNQVLWGLHIMWSPWHEGGVVMTVT